MMFSLEELIPFILLVTGMAILPGPNMMLYLSHTMNYGRKAGWLTVAGITSAFIVHITATILGLTALLVAVPAAYTALKYAGIAYLLYLAWKNYSVKASEIKNIEDKTSKANLFYYLKGFIGNVLNPQTTLLYFSLVVYFAAKIAGSSVQKPSTQHIIRHVVSILLALFAIKMAFSK
ncbi:MAG: LysE family translocator [Chitinophagaceae bacterium]|nr:LysE family translocator [Chitinophagaceae bacterium]